MADDGAWLRRSALAMTDSPALVRYYILLHWLGVRTPQLVPRRWSQASSPEGYRVS